MGLVHTCDIKGGQIALDEIWVERSIGIEKSTICKQYNVFPSKPFLGGFLFQKKSKRNVNAMLNGLIIFTLTYFFEAGPRTKPESELTLFWLSNILSMFAKQKPIKK